MARQGHQELKVGYVEMCRYKNNLINCNVNHTHSSNSAGDRGLAGIQGLKGVLYSSYIKCLLDLWGQ